MARTKGIDFRRSQGDRGLAPAQVAFLCIASFLSGVASAGAGTSTVAAMFLACGVAMLIAFRKRNKIVILLIPLVCALGAFYYHFYFLVLSSGMSLPIGKNIEFSGIVSSEPGHSAKSEYFLLRLDPPWRGTVKVLAAPGSGFRYGDYLNLGGSVELSEADRDLPIVFYPIAERLDNGRGPWVRQKLSDLKETFLSVFPRYLPSEEAAFMGGVILGAKADFSPDFSRALADSGTTHLVALSGYNIAILVMVIFGICVPRMGRRAAFYITVAVIALFVIMVGTEPSVTRAAAMGFLLLLSREIGRPYGLPYALAWTALLMVLFDPSSLFAAGFQLSFMSLLGIVYLSPLLLKMIGAGSIRENAALTLSAQIAVAPVALYNFGAISLTSFIANLLILPFMPATMLFGFILLICDIFFSPSAFMPGFLSHFLLAYEVAIIRFFAVLNIPFESSISWIGIVVYYLFLAFLVRRHNEVTKKESL